MPFEHFPVCLNESNRRLTPDLSVTCHQVLIGR